MAIKVDDNPAFPIPACPHAAGLPAQLGQPGMSLREYAAIHLRVPYSGVEWLDAMIRKAKRDEIAERALNGVLGLEPGEIEGLWHTALAKACYMLADALSCYEQSDGLVFDKVIEGKERLHAYFDTRTNTLRLTVMYDGAVRGELIRVRLNDRTVEGSRVAGWKVGGR